MENLKVKDLMVPVQQYCTVYEDSTLLDAVMELEKARIQDEASGSPYRAVLVCSRDGKVVGKLSQLDVLRSLEPRYTEMGDLRKLSGFGISAEYLRSVMEKFELWKTSLDDLCRKAMDLKVGELVRSPLEGEIISEEATLDQAVHQLVVGHFQSLLVSSKGESVGILRLVDVFQEVTERMKACKI
jgi:predicted transcriptional regulator